MDSFNLITSSLYDFLPFFIGAIILGWFVSRIRSIDENIRSMNRTLNSIDKRLLEIATDLRADRRDFY